MATNVSKHWHRGAELDGGDSCKLVMDGRVYAHADNITGVWDGDLDCYIFTLDVEDSDKYDPTKVYDIWEDISGSSNKAVEDIMLGDIKVGKDLDTHEALTAAHGITGDIVGTSDAQTLTNKTIDGDLNTLQDIDGSTHKPASGADSDTFHPSIIIEPDSGEDAVLHADTASVAAGFTIQSSNAAKDTDMNLTIKAKELILSDKSGNAIQLSGLAAATANGDAVRFDEFDALDTRVGRIETGGTFDGSPAVTLRVALQQRTRGMGGNVAYTAFFMMNVDANDNEDAVARYELYVTDGSFGDISAGATSDAELTAIRNGSQKYLIRGGEGNSHGFFAAGDFEAIVVAFDAIGNIYNSAPVTRENENLPSRDADGEVIEIRQTLYNFQSVAAAANDEVASEFIDWTQDDTAKVKARASFRYDSNNVRIDASFVAKIAAGSAFVSMTVSEILGSGTTAQQTETEEIAVTAYPDTPHVLQMDLSSAGLTNGRLYEIEISLTGTSANDANMRNDLVIELVSQVPIY